jgi:membrane associated rhomboid family serine protease
MFLPLPIRFHDGRDFHAVPAVNAVIVAINVLAFCVGWHPVVGPGTGLLSIVTYAFGHANLLHLVGNMFALLVVGSAVNRRLGNEWYLFTYLGTVILLGVFARLFCGGPLIGASGAIFAVIAIGCLLMPSAIVEVFYFALFPITLIIGLLSRPRHWVFWFIRWDTFELRAWWGLLLVPLLEFWSLLSYGFNWSNFGHLLGLVCGIAAVLLLPTRITMPRRSAFA